jgi:hypothetical protein
METYLKQCVSAYIMRYISINTGPRLTSRLIQDVTNMLRDQYSETKVMQFLFNLLRIKGLYMFRALLAHPQEALHKRHLILNKLNKKCITLVSLY